MGVGAARRTWHMLRAARQFATDEQYRSTILLRLRFRGALHQTTARTWINRYPELFSACREHLGDNEQLRLLSYGCSTGEEVITLRKYFPRAQLVGAEINPQSLSRCLELDVDERITFVHSTPERVARHGPYDAIFCLAVLQRTPHAVEAGNLTSLAAVYPFERFDSQLTQLDAILKPGGLLVVHHTQYVVSQASIAERYEALVDGPVVPDGGPRFDRESRRIEGPVDPASIFVKRGSATRA
jgi:cyclopropane fatty-acyl-phospholipid synthase-like methyltransferase